MLRCTGKNVTVKYVMFGKKDKMSSTFASESDLADAGKITYALIEWPGMNAVLRAIGIEEE